MRLFASCFLFMFTTGSFFSDVRGDCEGKPDLLGEKSGSILFSFPRDSRSDSIQYDPKDSIEQWPNVTCTWIINAQENQTVLINVLYVSPDTSLRIKFANKTFVKEQEIGALFSGFGRTSVEWSWRNFTKAPKQLHLRWNASEDSHDLAQVPYTHSDNDPVSPSPDAPNRVTHAPDFLGFSTASPNVHTLRGVSAQQGGGVSGLDDKHGSPIPQEGTYNGQEKAGAAISDLAHIATHSHVTQSTLSYTHAKTHTDTQPAHDSAPSGAKTISPQPSAHTLSRDLVTMATSTHLNKETEKAYTVMKNNQQMGTKIYSYLHKDTEGAPLNSTLSMASSHTIGPASSVTNETSETVLKKQDLYGITESDISMTSSIDEGISMVTANQPYGTSLGNTPPGTEMDQTRHSMGSTHPYQDISNQTPISILDHSDATSSAPVLVPQTNVSTFSYQDNTRQLVTSEHPLRTLTTNREELPLAEYSTQNQFEKHHPNANLTHTKSSPTVDSITDQNEHTTIADQTSWPFPPHISDQAGFTKTLNHSTPQAKPSSASPSFQSFNVSAEWLNENDTSSNPMFNSHSPNRVRQDGRRKISSTMLASSHLPSVITHHQVHPTVTTDRLMQFTVTTKEALYSTNNQESDTVTSYTKSPQHTQSFNDVHQTNPPNTLRPHISPTRSTEIDTAILQSTNVIPIDSSANNISHATSSQSGIALGPMIPVSIPPSISTEIGSMKPGQNGTDLPTWTERNEPMTPPSPSIGLSSPVSTVGVDSTSTPLQQVTTKGPMVNSPSTTNQWTNINPTRSSHHLTTSRNTPTVHQTDIPMDQPSTTMSTEWMTTHYQSRTGSHRASTPANVTQMRKTDKDWSHKGRIFVVEDQQANIKVETFEVLLQVVLEENSPSYVGLVEVEQFLHRVAGYQSQQVTWHNGPVLQTVVTFRTAEALSWLGRMESLLHKAGLSPLPKGGVFVGGVKVKNITAGGLHTDVCSWLFTCPSGFQCVSSEGNASCRSLCHSEYCKHQGICVHRSGEQPLCQCPVGEDFWFMGQRCDLRMTRQRLVGVCFGVLAAVAMLMAILSYLAVRRFKSMLIQAKVDQTRSSYRRFNHFDELSARFWGRSWPGSEDSLENPAFTHSDELLHMRALDRTCCYHDDTLSIVSTYQDSVSHLNTVYPHSSQYHWDLSNYSLADCVVDSGKASDLSVCSWPIEPIQWTPFPLLHQISKNTASVKASRPHSYCEGMELVDLEKSWTA